MKKNLIIRSLTGIVFVVLIVGGILGGPMSFALLFAIVTGMSTWEFCGILNEHQSCQINKFITTTASVYFFLAVFGFNANIVGSEVFIPYVITLVYLLVAELYLKDNNTLMNWAFTMMSQLYIALPFSLLSTLYFIASPQGFGDFSMLYYPVIVLSVFIFLWCNDSGAYLFGCKFGKRRLFPRISPKKSWEGSIGGGVLTIAISVFLPDFFLFLAEHCTSLYLPDPWIILPSRVAWAGLACVVVVFGTWGDLVESLFKRKIGIKDSGNILPGHGGMLDRFDSSLLAIPAAVVYVYTVNNSFVTDFVDKIVCLF